MKNVSIDNDVEFYYQVVNPRLLLLSFTASLPKNHSRKYTCVVRSPEFRKERSWLGKEHGLRHFIGRRGIQAIVPLVDRGGYYGEAA